MALAITCAVQVQARMVTRQRCTCVTLTGDVRAKLKFRQNEEGATTMWTSFFLVHVFIHILPPECVLIKDPDGVIIDSDEIDR